MQETRPEDRPAKTRPVCYRAGAQVEAGLTRGACSSARVPKAALICAGPAVLGFAEGIDVATPNRPTTSVLNGRQLERARLVPTVSHD